MRMMTVGSEAKTRRALHTCIGSEARPQPGHVALLPRPRCCCSSSSPFGHAAAAAVARPQRMAEALPHTVCAAHFIQRLLWGCGLALGRIERAKLHLRGREERGGTEYRAGLCDEAQVVRVELSHDVRQHVKGHEQHGARLVSAVLYDPRQVPVPCLSGPVCSV